MTGRAISELIALLLFALHVRVTLLEYCERTGQRGSRDSAR
jgi:hypothetical protein